MRVVCYKSPETYLLLEIHSAIGFAGSLQHADSFQHHFRDTANKRTPKFPLTYLCSPDNQTDDLEAGAKLR